MEPLIGLWIPWNQRDSEETEEILRQIKEKKIPCSILYPDEPYRREPSLRFNLIRFVGWKEIRGFIDNWETIWKTFYERKAKESRDFLER